MDQNPFQSPGENERDYARFGDPEGGSVTPTMIHHLSDTKPWVRFLAILGFVSCGLMMFAALGMMAVGPTGRGRPGVEGVGGGLVYLAFGILYIIPSVYLFRYASCIEQVRLERSATSMEEALRYQKSFWKYVGVFTLVMLSLVVVLFAIGIMVGVGALR